jgi:hypothetical protein
MKDSAAGDNGSGNLLYRKPHMKKLSGAVFIGVPGMGDNLAV